MEEIKKYFQSAVILVLALGVVIGVLDFFVMGYSQILSKLLIAVFTLIAAIIVFSSLVTYIVVVDKRVPTSLMKLNFRVLSILFPMMMGIGALVGIPKDGIRKIYVKLNNECIYSGKYNFASEDIIVLLPHCLQYNLCGFRITNDIENCRKCGKCNIKDLLDLKDKYDLRVFVSTGGTLARKIIVDNRPKAVIAVACERDLTSGLRDVKGIPVMAVFNSRPNGPCFDTKVDASEVENAVLLFTGHKYKKNHQLKA
ncbi:MAG: DUF116 domain-containing protein [Clostridioides sp.]|jgi:hypothetical protein|nr:DUF116 domain-containing protein [Clostridioides sp.]